MAEQCTNKEERIIDLEEAVFGNPEQNEMGMKAKVDAMYDILIQVKGITNFLGGVKGTLGFLIIVAGAVAVIKGWFNPN